MKILKDQLRSIEIIGDELIIEFCGSTDRSAISKITLDIKIKKKDIGEQFTYL